MANAPQVNAAAVESGGELCHEIFQLTKD